MKVYSELTKAWLAKGGVIRTHALRVDTAASGIWRVWGGQGQLDLAGEGAAFTGISDRAIVTVLGGELGGAAAGLRITLSGVEQKNADLITGGGLKNAPVILWRLLFTPDGNTLLDARVFQRGRIDQAPREGTPGGDKTFQIFVETPARSLGRRLGRMRSDADQRLMKPLDKGFSAIAYSAEKTLYWGGERPTTAGRGLPGGGTGASYGGGFGSNVNLVRPY